MVMWLLRNRANAEKPGLTEACLKKDLLGLPQLFIEAELENCPYRRCFSTGVLFHQYMLHVSKLYCFTLQNITNYIKFHINIINYRPSPDNLQSIIIINAVEKPLNSPIWVIRKFFGRFLYSRISFPSKLPFTFLSFILSANNCPCCPRTMHGTQYSSCSSLPQLPLPIFLIPNCSWYQHLHFLPCFCLAADPPPLPLLI